MGTPKDLNKPGIYAEALYIAATLKDPDHLARWLADDPEAHTQPFWKWYHYFAERLLDLAPEPEHAFAVRNKHTTQLPKTGRNDSCPCGSGKKFKQCHLGQEEAARWKLGSPTPAIRAMATTRLIHECSLECLDRVPRKKATDLVLTEMAATYHGHGRVVDALEILGGVLAGQRQDTFLLWDYWIARYAEWLVEAGRDKEGEAFLMDEFDRPRMVEAWQVAQKLAAFYIDLGDTENADTWVKTALEGNENNPFNHYLSGLLHHSLENWDVAVAAYEKAKQLSDGFRDEEKVYMSQLLAETLSRAVNRQPVEEPISPEGGSGMENQP